MNQTEKKLFHTFANNDEKPIGALFTTYNFDVDYFEEHVLAGLLDLDSETELDPALRTLDLIHGLEIVPVSVLADCRVNLKAQRKLPNYELLPVWNSTQHSKLVLIIFGKGFKLVISSANLTKSGIHENQEAYIEILIGDPEHEWKLLEDALKFLQSMVDSNGIRTSRALDLAKKKFDELRPKKRSATNLTFAAVSPLGDKINIPREFKAFWDRNPMDGRVKPQITSISVQSPFYEISQNPRSNLLTNVSEQIMSKLDQKDQPFFDIFIPFFNGKQSVKFPSKAYAEFENVYFYRNDFREKDGRFPHLKTYVFTDKANYSLLLLGSSNFSPSGLGHGKKEKSNWEANVFYFRQDYSKKSAFALQPRGCEVIENIEDQQEDLRFLDQAVDELPDPVIISASYQNQILRVQILEPLAAGVEILLEETCLNDSFEGLILEKPEKELTSGNLVVKKDGHIFQTFPIVISDLGFDTHLKLLPQDAIVRFIEARYLYSKDQRPSDIILAERKKQLILRADLQIDTSEYILYQIKEFNKMMSNLYLRLKEGKDDLAHVRYHLTGKFGVVRCLDSYAENFKNSDDKVTVYYQSLEILTQPILALEDTSSQEIRIELKKFYDEAISYIEKMKQASNLQPQAEIYKKSILNLLLKVQEKVSA